MLDSLVPQFAGGGASQIAGNSLFGSVARMMEGSQNEHGIGAVSQALGLLGNPMVREVGMNLAKRLL